MRPRQRAASGAGEAGGASDGQQQRAHTESRGAAGGRRKKKRCHTENERKKKRRKPPARAARVIARGEPVRSERSTHTHTHTHAHIQSSAHEASPPRAGGKGHDGEKKNHARPEKENGRGRRGRAEQSAVERQYPEDADSRRQRAERKGKGDASDDSESERERRRKGTCPFPPGLLLLPNGRARRQCALAPALSAAVQVRTHALPAGRKRRAAGRERGRESGSSENEAEEKKKRIAYGPLFASVSVGSQWPPLRLFRPVAGEGARLAPLRPRLPRERGRVVRGRGPK